MSAPYTDDSLVRALNVHQQRGVIDRWTRAVRGPKNDRHVWLVYERHNPFPWEFTTAQVYAFVVGLATAERAAPRDAER